MVMMALAGTPDVKTDVAYVAERPTCGHACRVKRYKRRVVRPYYSKLMRIAWCESTNRWHIATGNGFYGGLQFTYGTWHSVGGRGYPHWYSKLEQMYRAVLVRRRTGNWGDWPVCGYR
jgi:hypothetical protein